jgi:hypothetical protein
MLIEKSWKVDDICTVKMSSGEEIITKIVAADDSSITMSKPLSVQISQDPQTGRVGLQMVPGFALTVGLDAKLKVGLNNVMFVAPTEESIKKSYLANTSSLAIPSNSANSSLKL